MGPEFIDFNINYNVKVKLTEQGLQEHRREWEQFAKENPWLDSKYVPPKTDEYGWSTWQLWVLMQKFGHLMYCGNPNPPFELDIKIEQSKK